MPGSISASVPHRSDSRISASLSVHQMSEGCARIQLHPCCSHPRPGRCSYRCRPEDHTGPVRPAGRSGRGCERKHQRCCHGLCDPFKNTSKRPDKIRHFNIESNYLSTHYQAKIGGQRDCSLYKTRCAHHIISGLPGCGRTIKALGSLPNPRSKTFPPSSLFQT